MLNVLPSLQLKSRLVSALAALSLAGAALVPSSARAQIPQTEDFVDVEMVPKVKFDFIGLEPVDLPEGGQEAIETVFDNPSGATLEAGMALKLQPFYNYPSTIEIYNISPGISEEPDYLAGRPPSGLHRWQPDTQLSASHNYRVTMNYDGAGSITATMERANIPTPQEGLPKFSSGFIPAPPAFVWGDFNMTALPGPDNPGILYPINIALRVTPDSEITGGFIWDQPFAGSFFVNDLGSNFDVDGTALGLILFDNKIYFDASAPDALNMDKIIFADHPNIQPIGQVDGEYQVNFLLDGYSLGIDEDNPRKARGVTFTDNDILFALSPNILTGGHVRFRIELDPRLTPVGPMEFSAIVPSGPSAVMDWDKYSDAAPVNTPRPIYLAGARINQRGQ